LRQYLQYYPISASHFIADVCVNFKDLKNLQRFANFRYQSIAVGLLLLKKRKALSSGKLKKFVSHGRP
jgi:hypothetical protein